MMVEQFLWGILAGVIGSLIIAVIGWFFGLRRLTGRVDELEQKTNRLNQQVDFYKGWMLVLIGSADDHQFGKSLKRFVLDRSNDQ